MSDVEGVAVLDKPPGCTSHDVVARCRRIFGEKKVGHAGTLDPGATGVLLVGLGRATRLLQFFSGLPKRYSALVVLGVATTTLDSDGEVTATWDMKGVTLDAARQAAAKLVGSINQVPPMVSARRVAGRRLHELARAGVEVDRAPRRVFVYRFDVATAGTSEHGPVLEVDVECSSGTYVRALAEDLGAALGGGAHLRDLRRTAVGGFGLGEAVSLGVLEERGRSALLPPAMALGRAGVPCLTTGRELAGAVGHGQVLPLGALEALGARGAGPWALLSGAGELLAVYRAHEEGRAKPVVVLAG